jgi:putative membrane protein
MIAGAFGLAAIALYLRSVHLYNCRFPGRAFPAYRTASFVIGTLLLTGVVLPPFDALADRSFAWHMLQHVVMILIAPPLLLLGAPLLLAVAVPPPRVARRISAFANSRFGHALFAPITAWLLYVAVLWASHFSSLYELALEHPAMHVFEHALYFGSALLFWGAVIQVGYVPRAVSYPVRMFYLFLAIPQGAFLGFAINASTRVLYPHYLHYASNVAVVADQHAGGDAMWILGGFVLFVAFMLTASVWAAIERRAATA